MSEKRLKTMATFSEKHNQEGMHSRCRNAISTLNDLMKDTALIKHRKTLDEVAKAMARAIENDQKWSVKCKMLQSELDSNESRIKIALDLSERDKNAIGSLQNELKAAWNIIEELKLKMKNDLKQNLVDDRGENPEETGQKCNAKDRNVKNELNADNNDKNREEKRKQSDDEIFLKEMTENQERLYNEIERLKLQIFELEEELVSREKSIEEIKNALNIKSNELENTVVENVELNKALQEVQTIKDVITDENSSISNETNANSKELVLKEIIYNLKNNLQDICKKDQICQEKIKRLVRKNKILNIQLQSTMKQNNLMKLELAEQTKMLNLLSCKFCKLEEKDTMQAITIIELQNIRNKYTQMVGDLEQEIYEMKIKDKF